MVEHLVLLDFFTIARGRELAIFSFAVVITGWIASLSAPHSAALGGALGARSDASAQEHFDPLREETTLLASPLLSFGTTHVAFLQGVRVDTEPQGRESTTSWIRVELRFTR